MQQTEPVLIFDGTCGFCTSATNYILKHSSAKLVAHPWQFIDVTHYGISQEQAQSKVQLVVDGQVFAGHEAFAMLLRLQKNLFLKVVGKLLVIPPFSLLARFGYFLTAKYRHKLPGGTPACKLPEVR